MPETYLQRVSRHKQGIEALRLLHAPDGALHHDNLQPDFMGIPGLRVADYKNLSLPT